MKRSMNIWVIGGDMRQVKLAALLAEDGHKVHTFGLERAEGLPPGTAMGCPDKAALADCVVLPLPVAGEGGLLNGPLAADDIELERILSKLRPGQVVCGGMVGEDTRALCERYGLEIVDYFAREELTVANGVPTAEGAVQIAMEEMGTTLFGSRVLVVGFGRVGKLTAHRMAALGGRVSVAARKYEDLAWARAYGYGVEHSDELDGWLCGYDLVVNTVPARLLTKARLAELKPGCLVIDLASRPGGVDFEGAAELGVKVVWALSLPGKVAPVTAGAAIRDTIYNILRDLGV